MVREKVTTNHDSIINKNTAITVTHSHQRPLRITVMKADIEDQIKRKDVAEKGWVTGAHKMVDTDDIR